MYFYVIGLSEYNVLKSETVFFFYPDYVFMDVYASLFF